LTTTLYSNRLRLRNRVLLEVDSMAEQKPAEKKQACILHIFKAEPNQLGARGGSVRLSWISENCAGCRFMLDIPGAGQTDVSNIDSKEITVKRNSVFTLRVYAPAPLRTLLWEKTVRVSVHQIWS
jgi:hypothetical protein